MSSMTLRQGLTASCLAALCLTALVGCVTPVEQTKPDPVDPDIATWAEGYVTSGKLAGAVALVARDGDITHFSAHGVQDLDSGVAMEKDSLFRIYSMTKPITGVGVMMLVEDGEIGLDDPIADYLPEFKNMQVFKALAEDGAMETEPAVRPVTVRDLLMHNAGMTYGVFSNHPVDKLYRSTGVIDPANDLEAFSQKLAALPLMKQPGSGWYYSVSVDLQGRLIEVVSGQTLDVFFKERIFDPLGMTDTFFFTPAEDMPRLATAYKTTEDGSLTPDEDLNFFGVEREAFNLLSGGGGLVSTAEDYLKFSQMLLDGGVLPGGERLLKAETIADMARNHFPDDQLPYSPNAPGHGFGLGFGVVMEKTRPSVNVGRYYWGGAASTVFWIDPEDDTVAIFMTQYGPSSTYPLRTEFEDLVHAD